MAGKVGIGQARAHLAKSIFVVVIGSNDIFSYLKSNNNNNNNNSSNNINNNSNNTTTAHHRFVTSLIPTLHAQLKQLYGIGARKFAFIGTGQIGCSPYLRLQSSSRDCLEAANSVSQLYNQAVISLLQEMKSCLNDMNYSFFNSYISTVKFNQNSTDDGFTEVKAACCGMGDLNSGLACNLNSSCCANRKNHIFWDLFHLTEAFTGILTADFFGGSAPYVYPMNIKQLSGL